MGIIGNTAPNANTTLIDDSTYLHNVNTFHTTFAVDQVITAYHLYQSGSSTGKTAKVGVYDVSGGANESDSMPGSAQTFIGNSDSASFRTIDVSGSPIPLPAGTYGMGVWSDGWPTRLDSTWVSNNNIRRELTGGLPTNFVLNAGSLNGGAIAVYVETEDAELVTVPTITDVNSGATVANEDFVTITGLNFSATGNTVLISPQPDITDTGSFTQVVFSEDTTTIVVTNITLPIGSSGVDPVHFFVTDAEGVATAAFEVTVTSLEGFTHSIKFEDGVGGNVIVESAAGLEIGMTFIRNIGGDTNNTEEALLITPVSGLPSAEVEYTIVWPTDKPTGTDTLTIIYDDIVGDIKGQASGKALLSATITDPVTIICA